MVQRTEGCRVLVKKGSRREVGVVMDKGRKAARTWDLVSEGHGDSGGPLVSSGELWLEAQVSRRPWFLRDPLDVAWMEVGSLFTACFTRIIAEKVFLHTREGSIEKK